LAVLATSLAMAATIAVGCGDDDDGGSGGSGASDEGTTTTQAQADLTPVKDYLLEHTEQLSSDTQEMRGTAEDYYELAKSVDFDYDELLAQHRDEAADLVKSLQQQFHDANPAYEQMEGVVAGVPSLADFDVIIDAGGDASDPENAVPFSIKTPGGRTFKQPGNFNYLIETSAYGTDERFVAKGVKPDLDGDGKVEFGEALPDADFLVAAARDFETNAKELDKAAREWEPTDQDAFTALVVMTPTMSEYFEAWKNSRFIAGDKATEKAFVTSSRLNDITDILGGLVLVYDSLQPRIEEASPDQAAQTGKALRDLHDFADRLRAQEASGKQFTAQDADTLGSEAQDRAEAIAGQVSQAAGKLGIDLET
jgi:hypothetical protein